MEDIKCKNCSKNLSVIDNGMNGYCSECFIEKYDLNNLIDELLPLDKVELDSLGNKLYNESFYKKDVIIFTFIEMIMLAITFGLGIAMLFVASSLKLIFLISSIVFFVLFLFDHSMTKIKNKLAQEFLNTLKRKKQLQKITKAYEFYLLCKDRNITNFEKNKEDIILIAENKKINNYQEAEELFTVGKKLDDFVLVKDKEQKEEKELSQYLFNKKIKELYGIDKYINFFQEEIDKQRKIQNEYNNVKDLERALGAYKTDKVNPYVVGGIASSIGGSALGVVAALDTIQKNQRIDNQIQIIKDSTNKSLSNINKIQSDIQKYIDSLQKNITYWKNKIIYNDNDLKNKEVLNIKVDDYKILEFGNIELNVSIDLKEEIIYLNKPTIIDGTIMVKVYYDNKEIGNGYIIGNGYGAKDVSSIGFSKSQKYYTVCKINKGVKNINHSKIKFEFTPIKLWLVEK